MAKAPNWGSPRSRRDSTNDPEKYADGSVQTDAGNKDFDNASEIIEKHSGDYTPKYESPRRGPLPRAYRFLTR